MQTQFYKGLKFGISMFIFFEVTNILFRNRIAVDYMSAKYRVFILFLLCFWLIVGQFWAYLRFKRQWK